MWVDHVELELEFQVEHVRRLFGGPQASSCKDAHIVVIKESLGALTNDPCFFTFESCFIFLYDCALSL
jgi:hypothetical protein